MSDDRSTWADFLAEVTSRPGWSVARLARESGVHRSTIFRWLKGDDSGLTMQSVRAIAAVLPDPLHRVVLAAGGVSPERPSDPELDRIRSSTLRPELKRQLIQHVLARRAREEQARLEDLEVTIRGMEAT